MLFLHLQNSSSPGQDLLDINFDGFSKLESHFSKLSETNMTILISMIVFDFFISSESLLSRNDRNKIPFLIFLYPMVYFTINSIIESIAWDISDHRLINDEIVKSTESSIDKFISKFCRNTSLSITKKCGSFGINQYVKHQSKDSDENDEKKSCLTSSYGFNFSYLEVIQSLFYNIPSFLIVRLLPQIIALLYFLQDQVSNDQHDSVINCKDDLNATQCLVMEEFILNKQKDLRNIDSEILLYRQVQFALIGVLLLSLPYMAYKEKQVKPNFSRTVLTGVTAFCIVAAGVIFADNCKKSSSI